MGALAKRKRRAVFTTECTFFDRGHRKIVIELFPDYATLRLQGCREKRVLAYDDMVRAAIKKIQTEAAAVKAAIKKAKKNKRQ